MILTLLCWLGLRVEAEPLEKGAPIPDLKVTLQNGESLDLPTAAKSGYTLVYFYPKADTPGCTAQACSLRDAYATLQAKGVRIFGASSDGVEAQRRFKEKYDLPFDLIADPDHTVATAFGVPVTAGFTSRQAYLFHDGKLVWFDRKASTKKQADDILKVLEERPDVAAKHP